VERSSGRDDPLPSIAAPRCDQCAASTLGSEALDDQAKVVAVAVAMPEELSRGQRGESQARSELEVLSGLILRQVGRKGRALVSKDGDARPVDIASEAVRLKDCRDPIL
jgi:hypothetical protein